MKKIYILLSLVFILSSCGEAETQVNETEKKDFYVNTVKLGEYSGQDYITKVGQVRSTQDIQMTAQANGRVSDILVKAGDNVSVGQVLARLSDSIGSYEINLQRASIAVERAQINYDSNKLNLDKQVFDAEVQVEKLERNLSTLKQDVEKNILLSQDTLNNSQYDGIDTAASLQLQQLDNNIEKAKLDYEIKLTSDAQQIESFKASIKKEFSTIRTIVHDVIDLSDQILGVTDANKNKNDSFENFLGARDKTQKHRAELELLSLIDLVEGSEYEEAIRIISSDISQEDISKLGDITSEVYEGMITVLIELETTLNNSIESLGSLSTVDISTYISQINALQSQIQGSYAGFISTYSSIQTFLNTYKDNQASILKGIELQEKDRDIKYKNLVSGELSAEIGYDRTVLSLEDQVKDLQTQLNSAKNNLENAKKNRDITLRSLENAISDARIGYSSALKEYNKLVITSPINGTIASVSIDIGQEIFSGREVFSIVSDGSPEVEIALSYTEKNLLKEGDSLIINTQTGEDIRGTIYSISDVADSNLNYISTIVFEDMKDSIGSLVDIKIPAERQNMVLPLNAISTSGEDIGVVKTLSGSSIVDVRVRMGEVIGENIEIVSCAKNCEDLEVIISDISAYNENSFNIKTR